MMKYRKFWKTTIVQLILRIPWRISWAVWQWCEERRIPLKYEKSKI